MTFTRTTTLRATKACKERHHKYKNMPDIVKRLYLYASLKIRANILLSENGLRVTRRFPTCNRPDRARARNAGRRGMRKGEGKKRSLAIRLSKRGGITFVQRAVKSEANRKNEEFENEQCNATKDSQRQNRFRI